MSYLSLPGRGYVLGPFLRRELITSVRRGTAWSDRRSAVVLTTAVITGCVVAWNWRGWDRASVAGAASFALTAFGLSVAAQAVLLLGLVPALVAPAIASERDRKSLDALLATRLSAAEIVLGTMGAGLLRSANILAPLVPVLTLMVFLGGIDPRLILLAAAGLASTAFARSAPSAVVSAAAHGLAGHVVHGRSGDDVDVPALVDRVAPSSGVAGGRAVGGPGRPPGA